MLTGRVAAAIGFLRHRLLQRGFVHHHIRPARHFQRLRAGGGIAEDGQRFTRRSGPQVAAAVDRPAIRQRDLFTALKPVKQRSGGHAVGNQLGGVEGAGLVMLLNAIPVALHWMAERERGDPIALFVEHQTGADFDDGQGIIGPRTAEAQRGVNEFLYSFWSVDRQRQRIPLHRAAAQQAGQAEQMVAVQMGNKDLIQFAWMMGRMQKLMLGPFAAVKQPHFGAGWLLQIEYYRRHITRAGRHPGGCPQKS
ncbi:hypothetical protein KPSB59_2700004 [Klebsiella quasipneumoniae subsp. quasipneumoniae]|nr:hypothetical protein KPSB59_2700004 [Klebsiella quasipneumoniae subsp. quasipneumoniae]